MQNDSEPSSAVRLQFLELCRQVPNFAGLKFTDINFYMFEQIVTKSKGEVPIMSCQETSAVVKL